MTNFENGQVVVATREQLTGCGLTKIHKGAIVMIASNWIDSYGEIKVWKSFERKQSNITTDVNPSSLRAGTEAEVDCFLSGVRNINPELNDD